VIGLDDGRVNGTAADLSRHGKAYGIAADLTASLIRRIP
jgi:hypothetical protein